MMKKILSAALLLCSAVFISGCQEQQQMAPQAQKFELKTINIIDFETETSYTASVQGQQDIDIYPQVGGYLQTIAVKEGQTVKKGDLLFIIEQAPFQAAYNAAVAGVEVAKAGVATAELNYKNLTDLNKKKIISDSELQTASNTLQSAKAQLSVAEAQAMSAKTNLDFTRIVSPSDGVVGKLPYRTGALVSSALPQSLTVVSNNSRMYVYFSMNENQVYNLIDNYGSLDKVIDSLPALELKLSNGSVYPQKGNLESISGILDSATGSVSLRAAFENPDHKLLSGSSASVIIPEQIKDAIVIPKAATFDLQDKIFVYKVVDGLTKATPIELAKSMNANEYVVSSGLSVGDVIVASGAGLVREGTPVQE